VYQNVLAKGWIEYEKKYETPLEIQESDQNKEFVKKVQKIKASQFRLGSIEYESSEEEIKEEEEDVQSESI